MNYVTKSIKYFDPVKIALSGQAFRIVPIDDTHVELVAFGRYLQISILGNNTYAFSCNEDDFNNIWSNYFDLSLDYEAIESTIDKDDSYLLSAANYGKGIRILYQDIFETTISFIISQRRSIPSIMTSVERISVKFGKKIELPELWDEPFVKPIKDEYYSFPSYKELEHINFDELNDIGVGYRAAYIMSAIKDFNNQKITYNMLNNADNDRAFQILTEMNGIGPKVANCIMLFALHRLDRFPIDVWMERIINTYYGGYFNYSKYPEAGIIQQFMFFYERLDSEHK